MEKASNFVENENFEALGADSTGEDPPKAPEPSKNEQKKTDEPEKKTTDKKEEPKQPHLNPNDFLLKSQGHFLKIMAWVQIGAVGLFTLIATCLIYFKLRLDSCQTIDRIETFLIQKDVKGILEHIRESKRGHHRAQPDPTEDLDGDDGGYNRGEDGIRAEFYNSGEYRDGYRRV